MSAYDKMDWFDRQIPLTSLVVIGTGILILLSGVLIIYFPPAVVISSGIGIFALGLALISFGLSQHNTFESRISNIENGKRLIQIEEKLNELMKK
jgi:hypothetical protein